MRIIAGSHRGRTLYTLKGRETTRPTADRVKESIFSVLMPRLTGARVLDAFAGSAALGLESISRGAAFCVFFEKNRAAAQVCARNISLVAPERCRLINSDCLKVLPEMARRGDIDQFDLIFADPPYHRGLLPVFLRMVAENDLLAENGVLIVETAQKDSGFLTETGWNVIKSSVYGDTVVYYCQKNNYAAENKAAQK